jgi:hypothetical protein
MQIMYPICIYMTFIISIACRERERLRVCLAPKLPKVLAAFSVAPAREAQGLLHQFSDTPYDQLHSACLASRNVVAVQPMD